jgi:hypothetical protein
MPTLDSPTRSRLGATAFAVAAVMFLLYPVTRPWHDESTVDGATAAMSSDAWVAAHLFAMLGFILVPLGLLAVRAAVSATRAEPLALTATVTTWLGAGLVLPYYGAEDFGLTVIASDHDYRHYDGPTRIPRAAGWQRPDHRCGGYPYRGTRIPIHTAG